jgi:predicted transport protein
MVSGNLSTFALCPLQPVSRAAVALQQSQLKLWINLKKGEMDDPARKARDMSNVGNSANCDYEINLRSPDELDYAMTLVRQAYQRHV